MLFKHFSKISNNCVPSGVLDRSSSLPVSAALSTTKNRHIYIPNQAIRDAQLCFYFIFS